MRFDAYGNRTAVSGPDGTHPTASQFAGGTGYEREPSASELGLDYLYQRYYDPAIGRFISADPIGIAGGLNLYGYCENDPVNAVDPEGMDPDGDDDIPLNGRALFRQGARELFSEPRFQAGSPEREMYSGVVQMMTGPVGAALGAVQGITGCDAIAGQRLGAMDRVFAVGSIVFRSNFIKFPNITRGRRLGSPRTYLQLRRIAKRLKDNGWEITNGGSILPHRKEEYFKGPGGGVTGSAFADLTATKNGRTLRINTVDTYKNGQPTARQLRAAAWIRANQGPRDHLLLIPKERRR
jgi:RHS repeat-associated protein